MIIEFTLKRSKLKHVRKSFKYLETDESVGNFYLLINTQLKLGVNETPTCP